MGVAQGPPPRPRLVDPRRWPWPVGLAGDGEQPVPAYDPRPAPDLPRVLALEHREEDHLRTTDEVLERHIADLAEDAAVGRIVTVVTHHEIVAGRHLVN